MMGGIAATVRALTGFVFVAAVASIMLVASGTRPACGSMIEAASGPTFVGQVRTVLAEAHADSSETDPVFDSHSAAATHYGLFDSDVSAAARSGFGEGSATASQFSTLTATTVMGEGVGRGAGGGNLMASGGGTGESSMEIMFTLTGDTPYAATGHVATHGDDGFVFRSIAELSLSGPDGLVFDRVADFDCATGCTVDVDESGILTPGQYVLTANAHAEGVGGSGIGYQTGEASFEFAFELELSCPNDLNRSGAVDFADVLAILGAWDVPGGPEDLDGSGRVDFGDILVVISSWGPCVAA